MDISKDLRELLSGFSWDIKGIIDNNNHIYPIPEIPQVITGIFEAIVLTRVAEPLKVKYECQMIYGGSREYPELTLQSGKLATEVIAIDVKTARRDKDRPNRMSRMSLGSCGVYFKNPNVKKPGCVLPYGKYTQHWILGFVYRWNPGQPSLNLVSDVEVIVQEKWRIASKSTATGDTLAIGSIIEMDKLRAGHGDFENEDEFLEYWRTKTLSRG